MYFVGDGLGGELGRGVGDNVGLDVVGRNNQGGMVSNNVGCGVGVTNVSSSTITGSPPPPPPSSCVVTISTEDLVQYFLPLA